MSIGRKPTVFVSSTCYDLKQIRTDIKGFFEEQLKYDILLSEYSTFPLDPNIGTLNNCLRVVDERADIFILVVGCRYGSVTETGRSITNMEYLRAKAKGIPIYAFVDKKILSVLSLWKDNPNADFRSTVDTPKLFEFVDSFRGNDGIWSFGFETAQDIIDTLRTQLGYLFYDSLAYRQRTISKKLSKKVLSLDGICFQTVLLRPVAWEYKLFGQILATKLNELSDKRRDFKYSFTLATSIRLQTFDELFNYMTSKINQLLRSISYISTLIYETIPDAFGAPGVEGDPDYIIYAANKLVEIYSSIIDWSLDFNAIMTDEDFSGLAKSFSKMCNVTLCDIEKFSNDFCEMVDKIPNDITEKSSPMKFNITLSLSEPNTTDFYDEIRKLQQKFGIPALDTD
ncbi:MULTISPECIES: DUF4062 domain-containing protein [Eisenbergiella]|uniref:DUF4062 domain-containing protein n=1 Tax=Eisenbergiella massiliensis TaxID=1720294 RepID=A0A3E3I459_9FIRM|nr:DUF4062 domain-containing protein [Eisenbergiella massiliensis]RGE59878.1 DUF4062 domain-containing protein [Eisenbergiella massiliensis]